MTEIRLGRTGLRVTKPAFGVLPLQRVPVDEAVRILHAALDAGINFYDTANMYTDSEEKIGRAFEGKREHVIIATKSGATDKAGVLAHVELSLKRLKTDYIDLLQLHNPTELPDPDDPDSSYAALLEAKKRGYVRHIGITNHRLPLALEAAESGLYETLQFPFSYLSSEEDRQLPGRCAELDVGFIAMKGLAGGLLTNARVCAAFMADYPNVVPIWGIETMAELEEWVALSRETLTVDAEISTMIQRDRDELSGEFCRGCGYCLPCPAGIEINNAARMKHFLRRAPYRNLITDEAAEKMHRIDNCTHCNQCASRCPYHLDTPRLLQDMLTDFDAFRAAHIHELG